MFSIIYVIIFFNLYTIDKNMFKRKSKCVFKGGNPYQNLEKTSVLQEARTFNDTPVNPKKCTHILSKILYMINQVRARAQLIAVYLPKRRKIILIIVMIFHLKS